MEFFSFLLPLLGAGLQTAGGVIRGNQNAQYVQDVNQANDYAYKLSRYFRLMEQGRQDVFDRTAAQDFDATRADLDRESFDNTAGASRAQFLADFAARSAGAGGMLPEGMTIDNEMMQEIAKRTAAETASSRARIEALAKLQSYGAATDARGLRLNQNADALSTLNGMRRGSLGVAGQEQSIGPAYVKSPDGTFADLVSGVGALASAYPSYIH